jgi:hypothetical protein
MAFTEVDKETVFEKTKGKCTYCGKKLSYQNYGVYGAWGSWHIDHGRARARNGSDRLNNLFAACISCNLLKSDAGSGSFRKSMRPLKAQRKQAAIGRHINSFSVPLLSLLGFAAVRFVQRNQEPQRQPNGIRSHDVVMEKRSVPWDVIIPAAAVVIILIVIYRSHR